MKKLAACIVCMALMLTLFSTVAYAAENKDYDRTVESVSKTDAKIDREIEKSQDMAYRFSDNQEMVDRIEGNLIQKTDLMSAQMIDKAARDGVEVEAQYVPVVMPDETLLVDPCVVVGP